MERGFILQPASRVERGRSVIVLYGVLESGGPFTARDDRFTPHFWIPRDRAGAARRAGAAVTDEHPRRTMAGRPLAAVEYGSFADARALRDRLEAEGIACHEADIRPPLRYLIDRGIRGALTLEGRSTDVAGLGRVYERPVLAPADWTPRLEVLSFDIETDRQARSLFSIALHGRGVSEVLFRPAPGTKVPQGVTAFGTERDLIEGFARRVREIDPDVLTGWNVIDFDLAMLLRFAERNRAALELGRDRGTVRILASRSPRAFSRAYIPGRAVLDGIQLVRSAFLAMDSYALDHVAREVLGEGKLISGPDRADEIERRYREEPDRLAEYNLTDARLVLDILEKLRLVELAVERTRLTGVALERMSASIAAFDFLYLSGLARNGIAGPPPARPSAGPVEETQGGHVLDPVPGLYDNVVVFDFKSLYPSIIRTFGIDPLGWLPGGASEEDAVVAPNGAAFRRERGILPSLLDDLFRRREAATAAGDRVTRQAVKILMNSFYGVLGTPACRFHSPALANAITGFGREILLWAKGRFEARGHEVLYGDTDSLFVRTGEGDPTAARDEGRALAAEITAELAEHVAERWAVRSRLELEFERLYLRLLLPHVRHGTAGARKRYAGLVEEKDGTRVVFTGLEVVRRDWTDLAKRVQVELYERLFHDRPVEEFLRQVVTDLRAGRFDDRLVYRKGLRKDLDEYTGPTPPHVAAARKMSSPPGRIVEYVLTVDGPEPAAERVSDLDHEHYVQRQVRPVSEPVLEILGLDFDRVVGDDKQMPLF